METHRKLKFGVAYRFFLGRCHCDINRSKVNLMRC